LGLLVVLGRILPGVRIHCRDGVDVREWTDGGTARLMLMAPLVLPRLAASTTGCRNSRRGRTSAFSAGLSVRQTVPRLCLG
jgi:hypothetical protein